MFNPNPPFVTPYPAGGHLAQPGDTGPIIGNPPGATGGPTTSAEWDNYIRILTAAWAESAGVERQKLAAQIEDARLGRENALEIARLQAQTSRYGTNAQTMTRLAELRQNDRQFAASHGLEIAKAVTAYEQTPDQMFAKQDLMNNLARVGAGYTPAPMAEGGKPRAKTWEDFQALTNIGAGGGGGKGASGGGGAMADPRMKAIKSISDALPPSDDDGHDSQDWAALRAIESVYLSGNPAYQKLGSARQKIASAGMARLGYDPILAEQDRRRALPGQGNNRAY